MQKMQQLGVSTPLLQIKGVETRLGFPAASSVAEIQDYIGFMCGMAINFSCTRSDFPIQTKWLNASLYPTPQIQLE